MLLSVFLDIVFFWNKVCIVIIIIVIIKRVLCLFINVQAFGFKES